MLRLRSGPPRRRNASVLLLLLLMLLLMLLLLVCRLVDEMVDWCTPRVPTVRHMHFERHALPAQIVRNGCVECVLVLSATCAQRDVLDMVIHSETKCGHGAHVFTQPLGAWCGGHAPSPRERAPGAQPHRSAIRRAHV